MSADTKKPTVLIILDGWGHREEPRDNAIANGHTPVWDRLWAEAPHTLISGSGLDVGLPAGQMGNSEVGHMSLGSGRVIFQNITRIDQAIADGSFDNNPAYTGAIDSAVQAGGAVHVFGLLSPGGVHSHEQQMFAAIRLAAKRGVRHGEYHRPLLCHGPGQPLGTDRTGLPDAHRGSVGTQIRERRGGPAGGL
jgi:2,3-bisphosphoglycerate-independent phosphoglycerate mutase